MDKTNYTQINAQTVDRWNEAGWEWSLPTTHQEYVQAQNGNWNVVLTPTKPVPHQWFTPYLRDGSLRGATLLGLASGGGQQMPLFAALGAECTVLDYSEKQLAHEKMVAEREGYAIKIVRADMTQRLPFDDNSFNIIFHPVANCYVEDVYHVWNECHRVLKPGGVLLAGMDNGIMYLFDETEEPLTVKHKLPYNPLKDAALYEQGLREDWGVQFSHTLEEQLGGQLKAGLILTDLYEDSYSGQPIGEYIPLFIATRAVKP